MSADRGSSLRGGVAIQAEPPLRPWMRWLLRFAGCYNLLVGLSLTVFYHETLKNMGWERPEPIGYLLYVQLVGLLVGLFGAGYLLVSHRPLENRTLLWLGLWSKALGCVLSFYNVARGFLPASFLVIVIFSDLIYLPFFFVIARRLDRLSAGLRAALRSASPPAE